MSECGAAADEDGGGAATHSGSRKMRTLLRDETPSAAPLPLPSTDASITAADPFSSASSVASCRSRHRDANSSAPAE